MRAKYVLVSGCSDNQITEIDLPEQNSLDTPEAYLKAIAKAQKNLFTHVSSAIREMDEKEFEKVMSNVEKVLQRSPVWEEHSKAEGDFQVKKFSEEEYNQDKWYESNRDDYLDAFSPIISPEYLMEIESLMTELATVYGGTDVDTTGWKQLIYRASQDAFAQETGSLSCSSPQQITVSHASILPISSIIATVTGWFGGSEAQYVCISCCLECCKCADGCERAGWESFASRGWESLWGAIACSIASGGSGTAVCFGGGGVYFWGMLWHVLYSYHSCRGDCKNRDDCRVCPHGINEYQYNTNCDLVWQG